MMELSQSILHLSNLPGVSSWEDAVRDAVISQLPTDDCTCRIDRLGNLIVYKKGLSKPAKSILLAAHMDEVGLMITHITDEGYLNFDPVGKPDPSTLIGKKVQINSVTGVIGIKAIHLVGRDEAKKLPPTDKLYIDIGAENRADAERVISLGDVACFCRDAASFGADLVKGPALSGRIPCAILLQLLQTPSPVDYTAVFSVQKEVGNRGAFGAGFRTKPDIALVLDSVPANDVPGEKKPGIGLGDGVGISFKDDGAIYSSSLAQSLFTLARNSNLPVKTLTTGPATQAGTLQTIRGGTEVAALRIPVRYIHTPANVADPRDAEIAVKLLQLWLNDQEVSQ